MDDEAIFAQAILITSPEQRADYLDGACDAGLGQRFRIEQLLQSHFQPDPFLDGLPQDLTVTAAMELAEESVGCEIGPYRLLERIGEGGMGVVYKAEQSKPVQRRVALKVIKPGMDTAKVIARLEVERQTLAIMDHPNIARMLDAGTTESGLPYFVMELVNGVPITEFCDTAKYSVRERLVICVTLCQAIQHAHQKGIIHRDLKPGNVLVELQNGAPKVIDFGVAKAIAQHSTDRMQHTDFAQTVGTPLYMSPEQATYANQDIDTRSDVYSLGVVLYELLTGVTPFDRESMRQVGTEEMRRIVRDVDPPRPSARIAVLDKTTVKTIAAARCAEPDKLRQQLRGELDWIVMKCLEKDRRRRYESASTLAADIQRFLDDIPVLASPPSATYWLKKFVIRHRVGVATTILVSVAILLMSGVSVWKYFGEREARREMEAQRNLAVQSQADLKRYLYAADMTLAMDAAANGYVGKMQPLLRRHIPSADERDVRGFEWYFLNNWKNDTEHMRQNAVVFRGHMSDVYFVAESPDGMMIASASKDRTVRLWNSNTGELIRVLSGHTSEVNCLSFSPDGRTLASASDDRTVRIWDVETGQELWSLKDFEQIVIRVQFSPDGRKLAVTEAVLASSDATTTIWDVAARSVSSRLENQLILRFIPNGTAIATISKDTVIRIIDLKTTTVQTTITSTGDMPPSGVFSHDGKQLFTCGNSSTVTVSDVDTGRESARFYCQEVRPRSIAISPDDRFLAIGGNEGIARIFHVASGQLYGSIEVPRQTIWSIAYSHDGKCLLAGCADGSIYRWRLPGRCAVTALPQCDSPVLRLAISPDSSKIATLLDNSNAATLWKLSPADTEIKSAATVLGSDINVRSIHFSSDAHHILVGEQSGRLHTIETSTGEELNVWQIPDAYMAQASFFPKQNLIAVMNGPNITTWSTESHSKCQQFAPVGTVNSSCFSPDGKKLIATHAEGIDLFNVADGTGTSVGMQGPLERSVCAYSPDGKSFAIGHSDRTITIWDASKLQESTILLGHEAPVESLAYTPDGKTLASGSRTGELKLWNLETNQEFFELRGHTGPIATMAFSEDGQLLVTAGSSRDGKAGEIWLWSAPRP